MPNIIPDFKKLIRTKRAKIAVVGLGYVGLPLAIEFAKKGFNVLGVDLDKERISRLRAKQSYITDITSREVALFVSKKKLLPYDDPAVLKTADAILICVPTPLKTKYTPDISFIKSAVDSIVANVKNHALVVLESTTYPGTTQEVILPMFESKGLKHGRDFYLCFSPERIDPGNVKFPVNKIPKVIGGADQKATDLGVLLYSAIINKVVPVSSPRVAETVKLLENTFRIVNIGLIDEIAMMAHKMHLDVWEIVEAAATKPFGFMPFYPGPGVGGHCIPKDPLYLYWKAKSFGFKSKFIKLASDIISYMPYYVVQRVEAILAKKKIPLSKARILVLGVTYKKDVKDLRKSPGIDIINILQKKRVLVSYSDPLIPYLKFGGINLKSVKITPRSLNSFDCVIVVAEHSAFKYDQILAGSRIIFDTRNVYKASKSDKIFRL